MASWERRGALDIGSGSTKLVVADVRPDGSLVDVLYGQEIPGAILWLVGEVFHKLF